MGFSRRLNARIMKPASFLLVLHLLGGCGATLSFGGSPARDLGIPFQGTPGEFNAITDVAGVEVGHTTLIRGTGALRIGDGPVRTGVTAILPRGKKFGPVFAAWSTLNGNGEMTGTKWVGESGFLEEPILLTNTHSVGAVHEASIAWRQERGYYEGKSDFSWAALPLVAETWDGRLNDIHGFHVKADDVFRALDTAKGGAVAEGNVGGGTGMVVFRFKGGIGTSSRVLSKEDGGHTVAVLVQANFGQREDLIIAGVPVGRRIPDLMPEGESLNPRADGGSIIGIVATDAPLLPHQLHRLTKRVPLGIARMGGNGENSSGEIFLAFSTQPIGTTVEGNQSAAFMPNERLDPVFRATVQATEEAITNALVAAETMSGINGNTVHSLPHERLMEILRRHRVPGPAPVVK
jgi:D-aminopeptidase